MKHEDDFRWKGRGTRVEEGWVWALDEVVSGDERRMRYS